MLVACINYMNLATARAAKRAKEVGMRKILGSGKSRLMIQFIVSVTVIACTLLMAMQMKYISNKNLGFKKENKVIITLRGGDMIERFPAVKKELLQDHNVLGVSASSHLLVNTLRGGLTVEMDGNAPEIVSGNFMTAGDEFCTVMGMEFIAGRDFSGFLNKDREASYIVNESFIKKAGLSNPIGKNVYMERRDGRIIGVVKDFHTSLKTELGPFFIRGFDDIYSDHIPASPRESMVYYMVVNILGEGISGTLKFLEDTYNKFDAKHPIEMEFLEKTIGDLYSSEQRLMRLVGVFSIVCIFISCLGLFGLAAFTTEQRSKEIGIRKVLGASTWNIITILSGRIILLVVGGAVIASLIAFYAMDEWLNGFAYRIFIINNLGVFLVSAAMAACVAFATIALQSFKTAQADPVKALRYE